MRVAEFQIRAHRQYKGDADGQILKPLYEGISNTDLATCTPPEMTKRFKLPVNVVDDDGRLLPARGHCVFPGGGYCGAGS